MDVIFRGQHLTISDDFRKYATEHLQKLARHLPLADHAIVDVRREAKGDEGRFVVQVTVSANGHFLRAEERNYDMMAAVDAAADALDRQAKRFKERKVLRSERRVDKDHAPPDGAARRGRRCACRPTPRSSRASVVRMKRFTLKPMTEAEAIEQMELLGHTFFLFHDADRDELALLYRRRDGDYGMILQEASRMIITVTLNPAIDQTLVVPEVRRRRHHPGQVQPLRPRRQGDQRLARDPRAGRREHRHGVRARRPRPLHRAVARDAGHRDRLHPHPRRDPHEHHDPRRVPPRPHDPQRPRPGDRPRIRRRVPPAAAQAPASQATGLSSPAASRRRFDRRSTPRSSTRRARRRRAHRPRRRRRRAAAPEQRRTREIVKGNRRELERLLGRHLDDEESTLDAAREVQKTGVHDRRRHPRPRRRVAMTDEPHACAASRRACAP